MKKVRKPMD